MATKVAASPGSVSEGFFLELPAGFRGWKHALSIAELFR